MSPLPFSKKHVNDAVLTGDTLVSCSSDSTLKSNIVASGGLGCEVFIWDLEAAMVPISRTSQAVDGCTPNGVFSSGKSSISGTNDRSTVSNSNSIALHSAQFQGYSPISAKGHKESVYALAMNNAGTLLVSGGTEKMFASFLRERFAFLEVVRVWDPRTGTKQMKLKGHSDVVRALLLDSSGRKLARAIYPAV
eukprot:Gb_04178 [translate_table: standard]